MIYFLFLIGILNAEYRVFELVITNSQTNTERVVISTLDPLQYTDYYPVSSNEVVLYRETWMCYDNTSEKKICPNPRLVPERTPAGN